MNTLEDLKEDEYYLVIHQSIAQEEGSYEVETSDVSKDKDYIIQYLENLFNSILEEYELEDIYDFDTEYINSELDSDRKELTDKNKFDSDYYVYKSKTNDYFEISCFSKGWIDVIKLQIIKIK